MHAKVVGIDRDERVLTLSTGEVMPYDHLVLAPGLQYLAQQHKQSATAPRNALTAQDIVRFLGWVRDATAAAAAEEAAAAAEEAADHRPITVVVYGARLDAYTAVQSLLAAGSQVVVVQPLAGAACFADIAPVADAVRVVLRESGVTVHEGLQVVGWSTRSGDNDMLDSAHFEQPQTGEQLDVACDAFLCFDEKTVDVETFTAVNDSCLVFDGRLVVDNSFQTTDPHIHAVRSSGSSSSSSNSSSSSSSS